MLLGAIASACNYLRSHPRSFTRASIDEGIFVWKGCEVNKRL